MPLDYDTLLNWPFEEVEHTYSKRDTMLYALGLGFGSDPTDQGQLKYVYELYNKVWERTASKVRGRAAKQQGL